MRKEIPILYQTEMVQAILKGTKTKTRRICKDLIGATGVKGVYHRPDGLFIGTHLKVGDGCGVTEPFRCPYGQPGDLLWVRETFAHGYNNMLDPNIGKPESEWTLRYWTFKDGGQKFSDGRYHPPQLKYNEGAFDHIKWKPSIHMPKAAARIWLEVVSVKVERLQDISQEDAKAEGVVPCPHRPASEGCTPHTDSSLHRDCFKCAFKVLWNRINQNWNANPWVWVVEFKKVEKP